MEALKWSASRTMGRWKEEDYPKRIRTTTWLVSYRGWRKKGLYSRFSPRARRTRTITR